ncbi:MAG: ATP-binding protein [Acidobacteriota bacterium]
MARPLLTSVTLMKPLIRLPRRHERWWFAAAGFALGLAESALALGFGLSFRLGERDVTWWVVTFWELSLALGGYLVGLALESRRRERQAKQDLAEQGRASARLQSRLAQSEKLASLGQVTSFVAHEVRNPLAIIRTLVQNLAETLPAADAGGRDSCRQVMDEVDRLSRVTQTLVDFARPVTVNPERIALAELVGRTSDLARPLLESRGVSLQTELAAPPDVALRADPDLLCQVLLGLIANAAEASPAGGRIDLTAARQGDQVELTIRDQGPGVPEDLRDRIFEPFFTTRRDGAGLGPAVARQIVRAHGGRIAAGDDDLGGGRFAIELAVAP